MGIVQEAHNIKVLGSGDKVIVLGHGFGTDQSVWKHLLPHLVHTCRVVVYDNMGAGTTNPDYFDFDRYSTLEGFAYDLLAILEEFRIDNCVFVGHSVSAMIGILASISRPDLFSRLVLFAGSPRLLNCPDYYGGFDQDELDQLFDAMKNNYISWCEGFAPLIVGADMDNEAVQEFSRTLFNMRPDIALAVAQTIFNSDIRSLLGLVTVPCHIIQSMKDPAVPVVVSEYLHEHLGGKSVVEVMQSEGHLPHLSCPEIVNFLTSDCRLQEQPPGKGSTALEVENFVHYHSSCHLVSTVDSQHRFWHLKMLSTTMQGIAVSIAPTTGPESAYFKIYTS